MSSSDSVSGSGSVCACVVCGFPTDGAELCAPCAAALGRQADVPDAADAAGVPVVAPDIVLLEAIGSGGFGVVWRGQDESTGQEVAVKLLHRGIAGSTEAGRRQLWRFQREIEATAAVRDPGIVTVHRSGLTADGCPWYAMDFVNGKDLSGWILEDPPLTARLELFVRLCLSLHAVHRELVIHRDLKPANVMVDRLTGLPRVVDFGLASYSEARTAGATLTLDGQVMGTPLYMAPEVAAGDARGATVSADIYALGAILLTLCSGAPPYDPALPPLAQLEAVRTQAPRRLRGLVPDAPRDLEAIVDKAMARQPGERYASGEELAADVRRFLSGEAVQARSGSWIYGTRKFFRRHWKPVAVAAALLALGVTAGVWHLRQLARRNEVALKAYGEAKSLLTYLLGDVSVRLEEVGRGDVLKPLAERAGNFPWGLAAEFQDGEETSWEEAQTRARIAQLRGGVAGTQKLWSRARDFYEEADQAMAEALRREGAPAADLRRDRCRVQADALVARVQGENSAAAVPDVLAWFRNLEAAVAAGGLSHEELCTSESRLLSNALTVLLKSAGAELLALLPEVKSRILAAVAANPDRVNVFVNAALLVQAEATLAVDQQAADAGEQIDAASALWKKGLERWPMNRTIGEGVVRCELLRVLLQRSLGNLDAAKTRWLEAERGTLALSQNWIFSAGFALEEATFLTGTGLAMDVWQAQDPASVRELMDALTPLAGRFMPRLEPARYVTGLPRVDGMIPELWPALGDWMRLAGRIHAANGDLPAAHGRFSGASFKYYALTAWQPENPEWLVTRCEILAEWMALPEVAGTEASQAQILELGRKLRGKAEALPLTDAQRERLDKLVTFGGKEP